MYNFLQEQINIFTLNSFKRLGEKTQIIPNFENKNIHISNRLTHSLEVGSIAKIITKKLPSDLNLNEEQIFNICLLHDIGHPSLGHFLEEKLNEVLNDTEYNFEGNANNFLIIEKENLKLHNKTLVSLIKYPKMIDSKNTKGLYKYHFNKLIKLLLKEYIKQQNKFNFNNYGLENKEKIKYIENVLLKKENINNKDIELFENIFEFKNIRTLESLIMETSDDIAYLTHDLKDYLTYKNNFNLKELSNVSKYFKNNKYKKLIEDINKNNIEETIIKIRNIFINNVGFDTDTSELYFKSKDIEEFKLMLRKLIYEDFILPVIKDIENKVDEKFIEEKYFKKIKDKNFINDIVISETYKKLINNTNNINKKKRYMVNYLAEKTDKWLFV